MYGRNPQKKKKLPERNPLRNNSLFRDCRKSLARNQFRSSRPFWWQDRKEPSPNFGGGELTGARILQLLGRFLDIDFDLTGPLLIGLPVGLFESNFVVLRSRLDPPIGVDCPRYDCVLSRLN